MGEQSNIYVLIVHNVCSRYMCLRVLKRPSIWQVFTWNMAQLMFYNISIDASYEMKPFHLCKSNSILLVQNTFPLTDIVDNCANNPDTLLPSRKESGPFEKRNRARRGAKNATNGLQSLYCKSSIYL